MIVVPINRGKTSLLPLLQNIYSTLRSTVNEAINGVSDYYYFFYKEILHTKKHKKQTRNTHWTSIVNVTIRKVSDYYYFFYEDILRAKKHKKQTSDFYSDIFIRLKSIKSNLYS